MGSTWDLNTWQRVLRLTVQDPREVGAGELLDMWRETVHVGVRELRQHPLPAAAAACLCRLVGPPCTNLVRICQAIAERRRPATALLGGSRSLLAGQVEAILAEVEGDAGDGLVQPAGSQRRPYERLLARTDGSRRRKHGVYYTPAELARHLVQRLDATLRDQIGLAQGLADDADWARIHRLTGVALPDGIPPQTPFAMLLDPAAGDGQFLVEVIDRIHGSLVAAWRDEGADERQIGRRWNDYVPRHLLPRLCGLELMLPALVVAHLRIAGKLAETGFDFRRAQPLRLALGSTLAGPPAPREELQELPPPARRAVRMAWQLRFEQPFPLVLGNPPFASLSSNSGRWIADLLRGHDGQCPRASYYLSGGRPLGERKHWLHDDYVKFLRYAHWQIERCGCGVVALVANHGFLDNATFRGLRERLWEDFCGIEVLDLHGNRKKRELAPDGQRDQNVFGIDSGVATIVLARPPAPTTAQRAYRELWGTREEKLQTLASGSSELGPARELSPAEPHFLLVPRATSKHRLYDSGPLLTEAFPVHTTAPVTARDGLVVAFERQELVDRLSQLGDLAVPDDEIRRLYFRRRRSWRYPPGDTRGWQLAAARRHLASLDDWEVWIQPCLYRPFDYRYVFWVPWMIDWPRQPVVQPWLDASGPALIARRQMLPHRPCTYFWICDHLALDGVIRSDNRGSESLLPLYLAAGDSAAGDSAAGDLRGPGRVR
ncbi:MAG: hypothetical protein J5I93_03105, partial [Pirellulaceae bacterium]|nr:hypothetical protein [Pirellulaceae bacterium]